MPALMGGFANYLLPVQIGAPDIKRCLSVWNTKSLFSFRIGSYLAGLWEGDGHIWIPKTTRNSEGKLYSPYMAFTFSELNYPLVKILKLRFGGSIRHKVQELAYVWT